MDAGCMMLAEQGPKILLRKKGDHTAVSDKIASMIDRMGNYSSVESVRWDNWGKPRGFVCLGDDLAELKSEIDDERLVEVKADQ